MPFEKTKAGVSEHRMREIATTHDAVQRARSAGDGARNLAQSADRLGTVGAGKTVL